MKKILFAIFSALSILTAAAQGADGQRQTYFPYPQVPEEKTLLSERCNFLVHNFWERCNLKQAFSSMQRLDEAFGDWISFMPYATADTVYPAIDHFMEQVAKTSPKHLLEVGKMAEKWTYTPDAEYYSEQLYLPFCRAVATSKKVDKAERAHFEQQLSVLESSALGCIVPDFAIHRPGQEDLSFSQVVASRVVLVLLDPLDMDSRLAKARLAADYNVGQLVEKGLIKIVAIYPQKPTAEVEAELSAYPQEWVAGWIDDAGKTFAVDDMPDLYYLDGRHRVLGKKLTVENLIYGLRQINQAN